MRHLAAYLLLQIGGNASPSAADVKKVLGAVGIEADDERLEKLISELEGKDVNALIAEGSSKLASVCPIFRPRSCSGRLRSTNRRFLLAVLSLPRPVVLLVVLPLPLRRRPRRRKRRRRRSVFAAMSLICWFLTISQPTTGGVRRRYGLWSLRLNVSLAKLSTYHTPCAVSGLAAVMTRLHDP